MFREDIGKRYRIEKEHPEYMQAFGQIGDCMRVHADTGKLQLITDSSQILHVPRELCVHRPTLKTKALRNFTSVSQSERVGLLLDYGFWDAEESFVLPNLSMKDPEMLEGEHIKLWGLLLTWTFPKVSAFIYEPEFLYEFYSALEGTESEKKRRR